MRDRQVFEKREDASLGLGPVFNETSCLECHQNPVSGGPSEISEIRAGHRDVSGDFINPTVTITGGTISGRSLVNERAICPDVQEHVPDPEPIRTLRAVLNTLPDGFVEAVSGDTSIRIANRQPVCSAKRKVVLYAASFPGGIRDASPRARTSFQRDDRLAAGAYLR